VTILPVSALTAPRDLFRCTPLSAVLMAKACIARQGAVFSAGRNDHAGPSTLHAHPTCARCELGREVRERVGAERVVAQACEVCGAPVRGAKGRKPLCARHRRNARAVAR
jgi:hypothetical protein